MDKSRSGSSWSGKLEWLWLGAGFLFFMALGFWLTPAALYGQKEQPFQFSHQQHLQFGDCETCHRFTEDGQFSGIPALATCAECHGNDPFSQKPEEKIFVEEYLRPGQEVPWLVYSRQPESVFFSHTAHREAGLDCAACHGDHGESSALRPYEYNRLTGYSRDIWGSSPLGLGGPPQRMKMDDCTACHRQNQVRDACFVCHK